MKKPSDFHVGIFGLQVLWEAHEVIIVTPHHITFLVKHYKERFTSNWMKSNTVSNWSTEIKGGGGEHKNKLQEVTPTYSHKLWSQEISAWLLLSKSQHVVIPTMTTTYSRFKLWWKSGNLESMSSHLSYLILFENNLSKCLVGRLIGWELWVHAPGGRQTILLR